MTTNYKSSGIVRRVDDLGRVVIPKELRRTLRISEGDPLEMWVGEDGSLKVKRYSPMASLGDHTTTLADALAATCGGDGTCGVMIVDRHEVIVSRKIPRIAPGTSVGTTIADFILSGRPCDTVTAPIGRTVDLKVTIDGISNEIVIPTRAYHARRIGTRSEVSGAVVLISMNGHALTQDQMAHAELAAEFLCYTVSRQY